MDEENIYTVNNPYGYRLNINHPRIRELYERYKRWKDIGGRPPTDSERREFEEIVISKESNKKRAENESF